MGIVLHHFKADWDAPHLSPFCFKAATFLRLAELDYTVTVWNPQKAPKGKAPVVELDGELIADSSVIVRRLTEHFDLKLDLAYSPAELAMGHAVRRMLEEHTYWALLHTRWLADEGWAVYQPVIASSIPLPALLTGPLTAYLRRGVRRASWEQGLGRHAPDEIGRRAIEDLSAVEALLADRDFLLGDTPCSHDATVFAFVQCLVHPKFPSPASAYAQQSAPLMGYLARVRASAWPDWSA
ncbi:MAG: glutathione S-transferase family protein [Proteobacteria bacterium]|nr:glutathione S-transferase family protein [Pseudomonadota bacterium]